MCISVRVGVCVHVHMWTCICVCGCMCVCIRLERELVRNILTQRVVTGKQFDELLLKHSCGSDGTVSGRQAFVRKLTGFQLTLQTGSGADGLGTSRIHRSGVARTCELPQTGRP